jgi:hypothetical protein
MVTINAGHDLAAESSPTNSAAARRRIPAWVYSLLWFVLAATLIGIADRRLRRHENLAATVADSPVMIPFSDYLQDRVKKKLDWNSLVAARNAALASGNQKGFATATYAACDFAAPIDALETTRRQYLLELVNRYGNSTDAIPAYFLLLDPHLANEMGSMHAAFTQRLLDISAKEPDGGASSRLNLAQVLRSDHDTSLELQVLRVIQATEPMTMTNAPALLRLLELEEPSDPNRKPLGQEIAAYNAWHDQLRQEARLYQAFELARFHKQTDEMLKVRAQMPAALADSFVASADSHLIDLDLLEGRFAEARQRRQAMTPFTMPDLEDCSSIAEELAPPMDAGKPRKGTKEPSMFMAIPDRAGIDYNRWRGFLSVGNQAAAVAVANNLFGANKRLLKDASDVAAVERGDLKNVSPLAKFQRRTQDLPPELRGASDVWFVAIDLKPAAKGVPSRIRARVEMWISKDLILQVITADEPRTPRPKPRVTRHDQNPGADEYVEFFLSPDCWFNFYYQWAVTATGVTWDARRDLSSDLARLQFSDDKSVELGLKATASQTPTGWTLRITLPRKLLIPPGQSVVRFNVRRNRHVREKSEDIQQFYSWAPSSGAEHQPDRFGWLVVPQ